jgi:hypothetical protein
MQINYDDDSLNIMDMVNDGLRKEGIKYQFQDDGLPHDGYMIYNLVKDKEDAPKT